MFGYCSAIAPWLYPYQCHTGTVGWTLITFNKKHNQITIHSDHWTCTACKALSESLKYHDFVKCTVTAPAHTQWDYLTSDQLSSLLSKSNNLFWQLWTQVIKPLYNSVFIVDRVLVIQFTAMHLHTWSEAGWLQADFDDALFKWCCRSASFPWCSTLKRC